MAKNKTLEEEMAEVVKSQLKEDRENVFNLYKDLKAFVEGNPNQYAIFGDVLAKYADIMVKQTGQMTDFYKTLRKEVKKEDQGLTSEDMDAIASAISKGKSGEYGH